MIRRGPILVGVAVGLIAAMGVIGHLQPMRPAKPPSGPMLPDYGGAIRSAVIQYAHGSDFVLPVYQQFLAQQSADVVIYLLCPGQPDLEEFQHGIGSVPCKVHPIFTAHPMTAWSRDRWVALLPEAPNRPYMLLAPQGELQQEIWPQRAGDSHIADDLSRALPRLLTSRRSSLYFDGGDFLADGEWVFATPAVLHRNLQHTVVTRDDLLAALADDLHRKPILMDDAPDHHAGMFMMSAGNHRMLVADPSLGEPLFNSADPAAAAFPSGPDFSAATQRRFDSVALLAGKLGYTVTRIPVVPARDEKMYLTYVNVILDVRAGQPVVYMPTFAGQEKLSAAATAVWQSLGYEVRPIDCSTVWQKGGTLHCLVNIVERAEISLPMQPNGG